MSTSRRLASFPKCRLRFANTVVGIHTSEYTVPSNSRDYRNNNARIAKRTLSYRVRYFESDVKRVCPNDVTFVTFVNITDRYNSIIDDRYSLLYPHEREEMQQSLSIACEITNLHSRTCTIFIDIWERNCTRSTSKRSRGANAT